MKSGLNPCPKEPLGTSIQTPIILVPPRAPLNFQPGVPTTVHPPRQPHTPARRPPGPFFRSLGPAAKVHCHMGRQPPPGAKGSLCSSTSDRLPQPLAQPLAWVRTAVCIPEGHLPRHLCLLSTKRWSMQPSKLKKSQIFLLWFVFFFNAMR